MVVTLHPTIHDCCISLLSCAFLCRLDVDPIWVSPHGRIYFPKLDRGACVILDRLLESGIEISIIQEHIGVVKPSVEMPFHRFNGLNHACQLIVPRKHHEYRVLSRQVCLRFKAACYENLVMFFADFPAKSQFRLTDSPARPGAYLMAGGAPAGIIKFPGDELCCTTSNVINIMTSKGNNNTTPSGTEILELPFSRIRLLKNDNLNVGAIRLFSLVMSCMEGRLSEEGRLFLRFLTKSMAGGARLVFTWTIETDTAWT